VVHVLERGPGREEARVEQRGRHLEAQDVHRPGLEEVSRSRRGLDGEAVCGRAAVEERVRALHDLQRSRVHERPAEREPVAVDPSHGRAVDGDVEVRRHLLPF
jgi:hypothetical protein